MTTQSRLPFLVAVILCSLAVSSTYQFHEELRTRIGLQEKLIATRQVWNDQLAAMRPMEEQWQRTLPAISDLSDQYRIVQHINAPAINLTLSETGLTIGEPAPLSNRGQSIGLLRYPVTNAGSSLRLTADDFATAWQALAQLQARPDLRYNRAILENNKGTPTLTLDSFAVVARTELK